MRAEHFDRDIPIQGRVERFEDDTHAARTDDSDDLIAAESSQHVWIVGWAEKALQPEERAGPLGCVVAGRRPIHAGNVGRHTRGRQKSPCFVPPAPLCRHLVQATTAIDATFEVILKRRLLRVAESVDEELLDRFPATGVFQGFHESKLSKFAVHESQC